MNIVVDRNTKSISWVEDFMISDPYGRRFSDKKIIWKNIEFTTVLIITCGEIGLYLGVDDPSKIPKGSENKLKLKYRFAAIPNTDDGTDTVYHETKSFTYEFQHRKNNFREDYGTRQAFSKEILDKNLIPGSKHCYHIRIKVFAEEIQEVKEDVAEQVEKHDDDDDDEGEEEEEGDDVEDEEEDPISSPLCNFKHTSSNVVGLKRGREYLEDCVANISSELGLSAEDRKETKQILDAVIASYNQKLQAARIRERLK